MSDVVAVGRGEQVVDLSRERLLRNRTVERWVTKQTVAEHFSVSPRTVERWMTSAAYRRGGRNVPFRRTWGSPPRFQLGAVDAWLDLPEDPR